MHRFLLCIIHSFNFHQLRLPISSFKGMINRLKEVRMEFRNTFLESENISLIKRNVCAVCIIISGVCDVRFCGHMINCISVY